MSLYVVGGVGEVAALDAPLEPSAFRRLESGELTAFSDLTEGLGALLAPLLFPSVFTTPLDALLPDRFIAFALLPWGGDITSRCFICFQLDEAV